MFLEKINSPGDLKKLNIRELNLYAAEVRNFIANVVKNNGGHLASNLGAVELTIALHYVFNSPNDKILFDVGHQSYIHKIITGRRDKFFELRQDGRVVLGGNINQVCDLGPDEKLEQSMNLDQGGLSGFPSPKESDADLFFTGHSSTSLSLALGLARARDLSGEDYHILPVIGDGSFTGGMVYEALNDIGENKTNLTIILNDNKMSISQNISAISKYLTKLRLSRKYNKLKANIKKTFAALPFASITQGKTVNRAKVRFKDFFLANQLFENFGISYYGPIDGHDIGRLIEVFKKISSAKRRPSIIHLVTQKGRGLKEAEHSPEKYHGINPSINSLANSPAVTSGGFDEEYSANSLLKHSSELSFSTLAGNTLAQLAETDNKIVAITAAMGLGTGLDCFAKQFPDRYFDVSIAEQHAVSMAAGLAKGGYKPFFLVYSTFLQRGFDQILHEVSLNSLSVRFLVDRAGAVGSDGATHQGIFDLSYLSLIPNMTLMSPKDGIEFAAMLKWAASFDGPLAIRYPKNYAYEKTALGHLAPIEYGKWELLKNAKSTESAKSLNLPIESRIYLLACGSRMVELALTVAKECQNINVVNARFIKPLDTGFLDSVNRGENLLITLEDNIAHGGFGQSVLVYINKDKPCNEFENKESYYNKNQKFAAKLISFAHQNNHLQSRDIDNSFIHSNITKEKIIDEINNFCSLSGQK